METSWAKSGHRDIRGLDVEKTAPLTDGLAFILQEIRKTIKTISRTKRLARVMLHGRLWRCTGEGIDGFLVLGILP